MVLYRYKAVECYHQHSRVYGLHDICHTSWSSTGSTTTMYVTGNGKGWTEVVSFWIIGLELNFMTGCSCCHSIS